MIRQLQQEVWAVKVQATEESRKADELRRLHEQSTRQLRVMREQMNEQIKTIREQPAKELEQLHEEMKQVKEDTKQAKEATLLAKEEMAKELAKVQVQTTEEMKQVKEEVQQVKSQLNVMADSLSSNVQASQQPSYADVARTPPTSQPSNVRTLSSMRTTPYTFSDTLFCIIDTSRVSEKDRGKAQVGEVRQAIEEKVRTREGGQPNWRCAAMVKDVRNADRIKVVCRDEAEVQLLYPIKVYGANKTAVLDSSGNILPGAADALGKENEVTIANMHWLSNKENGKMYGSMVIYVAKASGARRLLGEVQLSAITARRLATRPLSVVRNRDAASVRRQVTVIETAKPSSQSVFCVVVHTSRRIKTVGCGNYTSLMATNLRILQLNVHKSDAVQLSMMNDKDLQDYVVLVVAEPYALNVKGSVTTTPNSHRSWIKFIPTKRHEMQWPIRSMLWLRSDLEAEQVPIPSADLTGAILRWPDREVLVVSVYVAGKDEEALRTAMRQLLTTIASFRSSTGKRTDIVIAGDFNRHDQLWGGDDVAGRRQGEAGPIIVLMDEHGLLSLLQRRGKDRVVRARST
ncbi:hypothetical protein BFJ63_vAg19286 [Fusarium oxysporum f. sp. narcissi]|uniref:Endonuclease/exonuclease/phosphatase domain-containing protein n=1 Tax=Fusarium oxysporum f. sp. narcissi TaxID=451672 RepID=A0A4Q2UW68_FUSOX|nr:hypothetical protein BFJ63_vAg19286 [Fusarium oxysporum f. sp. narcissi]